MRTVFDRLSWETSLRGYELLRSHDGRSARISPGDARKACDDREDPSEGAGDKTGHETRNRLNY